MRSKILLSGLGAAVVFLLATNPVVAQAAGLVTSGDIVNGTIKGKDVKDDNLKGKDILESSLAKVPAAGSADTAGSVAPGSITGASVNDRSLEAKDVAVANGATPVDFPAIPPNDCIYAVVNGLPDLTGAAVAVSARDGGDFSVGGLSLHAAKSNIPTAFRLVACNVTGAAIDPASQQFDYVAFR